MDREAGPGRLARILESTCRWLALAGGLVLLAAACVTTASVAGRWLFGMPIRGDLEIVALGMVAAISLFLPWCQLHKGHVIVGVFTDRAPPRLRGLLDASGSFGIALVAGVLAWRMALGGLEMHRFGDQSMVLRIPTWIGFAIAVPCFALMAVAALFTAWRDLAGGRRAEEVSRL